MLSQTVKHFICLPNMFLLSYWMMRMLKQVQNSWIKPNYNFFSCTLKQKMPGLYNEAIVFTQCIPQIVCDKNMQLEPLKFSKSSKKNVLEMCENKWEWGTYCYFLFFGNKVSSCDSSFDLIQLIINWTWLFYKKKMVFIENSP